MCGVGRKNTMQASQRGTCQHSLPASHIWATRAHSIHHMAGQEHTSAHRGHTTSTTWQAASRLLTGCRIRRDPDACVVLGERKQSRPVRGAHASIACQHHTWNIRGHITSTIWRAAWQPLTSCRIKRDPDACVVLGERKQSRLVRGAHASIAGQHHTSGQQGHRIYTTWLAGTHIRASRAHNKHQMAGSKPITHGLQNQEGSRCMCGVGRKKTKQAGQRGTCQHSLPASHIWATRAHNQHHMAGSKPITHGLQNQEGSRCMCGVGRKKTKQAGQRGTCQHSLPASHIWATRAQNIHHMAGQEHTSAHRGHTTSTTWQAASRSLTRCRNRRDPDACVG